MKAYPQRNALSVVFFAMMLLCGCGKNTEVTMKEVKSADETFSINVDAAWSMENFGVDNSISVESRNRDENVAVMQFPIRATGISGVNSLDDLRAFMEKANQMSNIVETEKPEIQGVKDAFAYTAVMKAIATGQSAKCYFVYMETEYAYYMFGGYSSKMEDSDIEYFEKIVSSFKEYVDPQALAANDIPYTVKWFNASAAILTKVNNWDYTVFGGMPANSYSQKTAKYLLENWWSVTDKETAEETLTWLLERGQQAGFSEKMIYMEEALDCSLEVAGMIQAVFESWDDYMESYFSGYEYWSGESSEDRREMYEDLKKASDSPFTVDFKIELKKSW